MKDNFEQCLAWLLKHEGGYVNSEHDPGGMTNKGITARVYEQWLSETVDSEPVITEEIMRNIPDNHVAQIYREEYWNRVAGDKLPAGLDWSVFDWAVNSGVGRSARTLQKIIGVTADGGIGPITLNAIAVTIQRNSLQICTAGVRLSMSASKPLSISARAGRGAMKKHLSRQ